MVANEAFTRVVIDKALEASGWNLLDHLQVEFEFNIVSGRADYLLRDGLGRVLCVLEAKREDLDPYDAKEQARGYAENLSAPFIILSNGREHWFWNYGQLGQRDAYRIERLPSRDDLERARLKNLQPPRPLQLEVSRSWRASSAFGSSIASWSTLTFFRYAFGVAVKPTRVA